MKFPFLPLLLAAMSAQAQPTVVDVSIIRIDSFMACKDITTNGPSMSQLIRQTYRPSHQSEAAWTYAAKGTVSISKGLKLPIQEVLLGVCDRQGHTGCGSASFRGLVIGESAEHVKALLLKAHGIDYTQAQRDEETGIPSQAILTKGRHPRQSVLYYDSGSL
jgi:hypothetical protein